jgi:hypothetical protein
MSTTVRSDVQPPITIDGTDRFSLARLSASELSALAPDRDNNKFQPEVFKGYLLFSWNDFNSFKAMLGFSANAGEEKTSPLSWEKLGSR